MNWRIHTAYAYTDFGAKATMPAPLHKEKGEDEVHIMRVWKRKKKKGKKGILKNSGCTKQKMEGVK